jgi:hypothetical protein
MTLPALFISQTDNDGREWGDFTSCHAAFGTNACTLEGAPSRIIGTPRTTAFASIEPVDLEVEPIRCCWDVVDMVMRDGGAFSRSDDDTDD